MKHDDCKYATTDFVDYEGEWRNGEKIVKEVAYFCTKIKWFLPDKKCEECPFYEKEGKA